MGLVVRSLVGVAALLFLGGLEVAGATFNVVVNNGTLAYSPSSLSVFVGDRVTWSNNDPRAHTVTFDNGSFDAQLNKQDTPQWTATLVGTYTYHCKFHSGMTGTIVVKAAATPTPQPTATPKPTAAPTKTAAPTAAPTAPPTADPTASPVPAAADATPASPVSYPDEYSYRADDGAGAGATGATTASARQDPTAIFLASFFAAAAAGGLWWWWLFFWRRRRKRKPEEEQTPAP